MLLMLSDEELDSFKSMPLVSETEKEMSSSPGPPSEPGMMTGAWIGESTEAGSASESRLPASNRHV